MPWNEKLYIFMHNGRFTLITVIKELEKISISSHFIISLLLFII